MRLKDALKRSAVKAAKRRLLDGHEREGREPNIVLRDAGKVKAFRALGHVAWERRPMREAKLLEDWQPAVDREPPELLSGDAHAETEDVLHPHLLPGDDTAPLG